MRWLFTKNLTADQADALATPLVSSNNASLPSGTWPDQGNLQDVHPSLVFYASLFPPKPLSTDFTGHPAPNFESQSLDQSITGANAFVPAAWNAQMSSYPPTEIPSPAVSGGFANDTNSYNLFQQFYQETPATILDTWGFNDVTDLGQMSSIDSDMGEEWMTFMEDSGIVNATPFGAEPSLTNLFS